MTPVDLLDPDDNNDPTRSFLPEKWMREGVDVTKLSTNTVFADRWDRDDLRSMLKELPPFSAARKQLGDFAPTGEPAMADAFYSLLKAEPELLNPDEMRPSHLVNHHVFEQFMELDELEHLRRYSVNDDVQAALSATSMEPELEILFDRLKQQQKMADQLQEKLQQLANAMQEQTDLDDLVRRWAGENEDGELTPEQQAEADARQAQTQAQVDAARAEAEAQAQALQEALEKAEAGTEHTLRQMVKNAADDAQKSQETARSWGLEPGVLQHMPAKERMELAKRLNNERFRRIADLFGPMRNLMLSEQQRKVVHSKEEVYDVGLGNDLGRILPQEVINLRMGPTRLDFLRRYSEGRLLQYDLRGIEKLSRGGILLMEDGSGSMSGERELWAKAVMLCLLHLARIQKRPMHVIHFGSPGQYRRIDFVTPEDYHIDKVLDAAEIFFAGGTDFQTPMQVTLDILSKEFNATGAVRGDAVMLTDGECGVSNAFMETYLNEMDRMSATTWGIDVSGSPRSPGPLMTMSQNKVATIKDFLSGNEIRGIFRGL